MEYTRDGLGSVIQEHRIKKQWSQQQLAEAAGYKPGPGAGVSMSRVEGGYVLPGRERLTAIAAALDVPLEKLEEDAAVRTAEIAAGETSTGRAATAARHAKTTAQRTERLDQECRERAARCDDLASAFDDAYQRSLNDFYLPLVEIAGRLEGATPPAAAPARRSLEARLGLPTPRRFEVARAGVSTVASAGLQSASFGASQSIGQLAAYATMRAVIARGTAGTGAPISGLHGAVRDITAQAWLGGGPRYAGGGGAALGNKRLALVQNGVAVAIPALTSIYLEVRRQKKEAQMAELCDEVEDALDRSERGYQAAADLLPRATSVLDDIAVHGARALNRWAAKLGPTPWGPLDEADQVRYQEFVQLAGCQVVAGVVDLQELLTTTGADLEDLIASIDEDLNYAEALVAVVV